MSAKIKILLIEDNPSDARLIDIYLKESFLNLYTLTNAPLLSKGIELMDRNKYDIVLLDLTLPDSNGLGTFKKIFEKHPGTPIVVLTGMNDESLGLVTVQLGAQEFLFKNDLDSKILKRSVNYSIERHLLVSKLKEYNNKLEFSEKRLKEAQQIAHVGHWEWDIDSDSMTWSEELYRIYGLNPEEVKPTYQTLMQKVHQEDLPALRSTLESGIHNHNAFSIYYRIIRSDNSVRFIHGNVDVLINEQDKAVRMIGTVQDITEAKREEELEMLSYVAIKSYNSVIISDAQGKIEWANEGFSKLFGYTLEEVKGTSGGILRKEDVANLSETSDVFKTLQTAKRPLAVESRKYKKNGEECWLLTSITPVLNDKGEISKFISIDSNITKQKLAEKELRRTTFLFKQLIENISGGVLFEDEKYNISYINKRFVELFKIDTKPEDIIGQNANEFIENYKNQFQDAEQFAKYTNSILEQKKQVLNEELTLFDGRTFERNGVPVIIDSEFRGYLWLYRDYTDRKKAEEELKTAYKIAEHSLLKGNKALNQLMKAKQQVEEALKIKDQFLANMSHEIRTPMNAVLGFTNLLLKSELTADQKQYINAIKVSGENLIIIINDILDFSKIESGKVTFEKIKFKLKQVLSSLVELMLPKSIEKNIKLSSAVDEKVPDYLIGDPTRLTQILINLAGNAIKFTSKGSVKISVSLIEEKEETVIIEFSIQDTGIGIPENQRSSIFESFTQASNDTTRKYGGTGLGLTITKQLIELQGGAITVKSEVNKGSEFSFRLEFEKSSLTDPQTNDVQDNGTEIKENIEGLNVLLVEDNSLNQILAKKVLTDWKWNVEVADNGLIAVEKAGKNDYDVILMDIQMPEMDGYDATRYIREKISSPKNTVPIIAMTAHALSGEAQKCFSAGMNDYISKPFDPNKLYSKIVSVLSKSKQTNIQIKPSIMTDNPNNGAANGMSIDLTYLKQLASGSNKFITEIITMFLQQTPEALDLMEKHLNNKDWTSLRAIAHKMKPSISFMGINELKDVITAIENNAEREINLESLPELVMKMKNTCQKAYTELEAEQKNFA